VHHHSTRHPTERKIEHGRPLRNHNETDVRADYALAKGTLLEGLVALRYSWLRQDGAAQTQTDFRAILNYLVRF
jgi:hypothetical protein